MPVTLLTFVSFLRLLLLCRFFFLRRLSFKLRSYINWLFSQLLLKKKSFLLKPKIFAEIGDPRGLVKNTELYSQQNGTYRNTNDYKISFLYYMYCFRHNIHVNICFGWMTVFYEIDKKEIKNFTDSVVFSIFI